MALLDTPRPASADGYVRLAALFAAVVRLASVRRTPEAQLAARARREAARRAVDRLL